MVSKVNKKKIFVLAGNGPYLNRGCEAIVRGTVKILRQVFENPRFVNAYFSFSRPLPMPTEKNSDIFHRPIPSMGRWSPKWMVKQIFQRTIPRLDEKLMFHSIEGDIRECTAVLSIGGDNYSLDYGVPKEFVSFGKYVKRFRKPLIIWGASIGPFDNSPRYAKHIHEHFKSEVFAIFVREEISRAYLLRNGITKNVIIMGDPAFQMDPEPVSETTLGFPLPKKAIGLNLSPLMAKYATNGNMQAWEEVCIKILVELRQNFRSPIVLIPHVTLPQNNDYEYMCKILEGAGKEDSQTFLVPSNLSAPQVKWVISNMACLIGARTHATIASFSSFVPTISLGYSLKAEGINKQVFGNTEFLIRAKDINEKTVVEAVKNVLKRRHELSKRLSKTIPQVQKITLDAGLILAKLLKSF